jgi:hypothetical protein
MNLPTWTATNRIPLSPDEAVRISINHLNRRFPLIPTWKVSRIEIKNEFDDVWIYALSLTHRGGGGHHLEFVRVLMNGEVWQPDKSPRP